MKINPHGQQPPIQPIRPDDASATRAGTESNRSGEDNIVKGDVPESPQLSLRLLTGKLKSEAGIRESVVENLKARLATGELVSQQAAEQTARDILGL